jgi:3-phenylpropionate/trans-cinnamate dioxygenase ferredoxin reductase subunit
VSEPLVIVGGGQAACQAIETLRREGYNGDLVLVCEEPYLPYQRPPLSKQYLLGQMERDQLFLRHSEYYRKHDIDMRLGMRAVSLSPVDREIELASGERLRYHKLLLATGARPRPLSVACNDPGAIHYIRGVADVDRLMTQLSATSHLLLIGGGYIGLEIAAASAKIGCKVQVLEMSDRVMSRVVSAPVSQFFTTAHQIQGVEIVCNAHLHELTFGEAGVRAACTNGANFQADVVVAGIGAIPEMSLAVRGGITCSNGIDVDVNCQTSDPHIFAAGDCTCLRLPRYRVQVRLESVNNAFEQGKTAALSMLGKLASYDPVPWFWSDQYENKLLIAGLSQYHTEQTMRGDPGQGQFSVCYLKDGALIAIEAVNCARDFMQARQLIQRGARPNIEKLGDFRVAIKDSLQE